jgi:N-acetyltransferase 10
MLSLVSCKRCLVVDDQLTVLPISSKVLDLVPEEKTNNQSINDQELAALKENMKDTQPVGCLVNCCKTVDQVINL